MTKGIEGSLPKNRQLVNSKANILRISDTHTKKTYNLFKFFTSMLRLLPLIC